MRNNPNTFLLLVLWAVITMPLWVGAEERQSAEPQAAAAQATTVDNQKPAENAPQTAPVGNQTQQSPDKPSPADSAPVSGASAQQPSQPETFASIELDRFIEQEQKAAGDGKKLIKMAVPVSFEAKLKRQPEERQMEYVYKALELTGVKPIPEVHHRMFVESGEGRIIPVYVEGNAVKKVNAGLKEEEKARFQGYHVYSYAKGPAILVVDFAAIP